MRIIWIEIEMMPQMPPGKVVGFKPLSEEWNYYSVDDGYILGVKLVLTKVMKTNQTDPAGTPIYVIQSNPVVQVLTQEDYRSMTNRNTIPK